MAHIQFNSIARLADNDDNVAIATQRIELDTFVNGPDGQFMIPHTVLEGHRFVIKPISAGDPLFSWSLPFGTAIRDLSPGEYVCNKKIYRLGSSNAAS